MRARLTVAWTGVVTRWPMWGLIVVAAVYLTAITLMHTSATSPIDEWVYIDYLVKIPQQGIVIGGEHVGAETLTLMSCHGTSPFGPIGTACGTPPQYADFPNRGKTTADTYSPVFFYLTYAMGWLLGHVMPLSELTSWRLTGLAWIVAGLVMFWMLLRAWNVGKLAIFALGLAFVASPFAWWTYTYVSTDAPSFFLGALLFLLATRTVRSGARTWPVVLVSVLAVAVKASNLIGVGAVVLYLGAEFIASAWRQRRTGVDVPLPWRWIVVATSSLVASGIVIWGWNAVSRALADGAVVADQGIATPLTGTELLMQLTNFLPGVIQSSAISEYMPGFVYAPLGWLTVAGVLGAAFVAHRGAETNALVVSTVVSAALAAPVIAVVIYATTGTYFQIPSRYGATALPVFLLCAGLLVRNRWMSGTIIFYAASLCGVGLWLSQYLSTLAP